ncbi:DUF547 domain-containing protein [uncultured Abyssibacter sp.]|uniref:DUF547 domain-containing protein n=1 Tax=uncultured Abyssibacter sp. TaxID=2320202 RepID=UPI0032B2232C
MSRRLSNGLARSVGILSLLWAASSAAAPKSDPWPFWAGHDPESEQIVDHGDWSRLLQRYVRERESGANRFDYGAVSDADRDRLAGYVDTLAAIDPRGLNRAEQKAYWINLYNALTVQQILEAYPVGSIRDIRSGLFSPGPWKKDLVSVAGQPLTLNDIEHRILRPIWQDPLIHYGVNCASIGCPDLLATAYTGDSVDEQLAGNARAYVNDARGAQVTDDGLMVSSIYIWFQADFGGSDAGVIEHLRRYADPALRKRLDGVRDIDDDRYDWSLNDVAATGS